MSEYGYDGWDQDPDDQDDSAYDPDGEDEHYGEEEDDDCIDDEE